MRVSKHQVYGDGRHKNKCTSCRRPLGGLHLVSRQATCNYIRRNFRRHFREEYAAFLSGIIAWPSEPEAE